MGGGSAGGANFASLLHGSGRRIRAALLYSFLEWILIWLLLFNGGFSYLISKFAAFFGLQPPCVLCSRIDHLFESGGGDSKRSKSYRSLLCDSHVAEMSRLEYCSAHRRFADAGELCEDCAGSLPAAGRPGMQAVLSWMRRSEMGESDLRCACCHVVLESGFYSWKGDHDSNMADHCHDGEEGKKPPNAPPSATAASESRDASLEFMTRDGEMRAFHGDRLVSLELIDEITLIKNSGLPFLGGEEEGDITAGVLPAAAEDCQPPLVIIESSIPDRMAHVNLPPAAAEVGGVMQDLLSEIQFTMENPAHCDVIVDEKGERCSELLDIGVVSEESIVDWSGHKEAVAALIIAASPGVAAETFADLEDENKSKDVDSSYEISIGSEIPEPEETEDHHPSQMHDEVDQFAGSLSDAVCCSNQDHTLQSVGEVHEMDINQSSRRQLGANERRDSGTESLDGSIGSEQLLTVESLNLALRAERQALTALYAELEEERSAAAVAASQTMAMITRLQEEKAAVQMEALQFQRMMEEQSEFDQEALQLLNELVVKKEKENQDLERDLEACRQKVLVLEAKERRWMMARSSSGGLNGSSTASSGTDDSICDGSPDATDRGEAEKHIGMFEEERLSILEQLRGLEDQLFQMEEGESDEVHQHEADNEEDNNHNDASAENGRKERSGITQEIDNVYERLHALEADGEFLKHCLKSLRKGSEGVHLIREILQHLHDLRRVESQLRHSGNDV